MKTFLHDISTRTETPTTDTILDWSGYIDQGKQLSILHNLLADSMQKLQPTKQQEMQPLQTILANITKTKEFTGTMGQPATLNGQSLTTGSNVAPHQNQENQPKNGATKAAERGVIRGVLTPSSLEKNIFRYNDPTVSPLLKQTSAGNNLNQSQTSINGSIYSSHLQHSHSTSSISSASNSNVYQSHLIPTTIHHHHHHHAPPPSSSAHSPERMSNRSIAYLDGSSSVHQSSPSSTGTGRNYNTTSHYFSSATATENDHHRRSPAIRANTLPRNNGATPESNGEKENNNTSLIQIGLEPSNAFVRKSPTPHLKSTHSNSRGQNLNGSQLSLLSDRTTAKNALNLNLNLGIPMHQQAEPHNQHSNMPMNLEDLDDLLKYAEEHASADDNHNCGGGGGGSNNNTVNSKPKDILTTKGSNVSIGHCSSGYQSIATQSQSSSPVELGLPTVPTQHQQQQPSSIDFINKNRRTFVGSSLTNGNSAPKFNSNAKYGNIPSNNNNGAHPPLAFKNPLYQLQQQHQQQQPHNGQQQPSTPMNHHHHYHHNNLQHSLSQKSSSLTPSSSEERLSTDNYCPAATHIGGGTTNLLSAPTKTNGNRLLADSDGLALVSLNGSRRLASSSSARLPRTNPLMQVSAFY